MTNEELIEEFNRVGAQRYKNRRHRITRFYNGWFTGWFGASRVESVRKEWVLKELEQMRAYLKRMAAEEEREAKESLEADYWLQREVLTGRPHVPLLDFILQP